MNLPKSDSWARYLDFCILIDAIASNLADKSSDMKIGRDKAGCKSGNKTSDTKATYATQASTTASKVGTKSSGTGASSAPKTTTAAANAPIAAEQVSNTETAKMSAEIRPFTRIPRPEESNKPVATYEFIWHYDHDPVFVPREITQTYWQSDSKELVQFYTLGQSLAESSDGSDSSDDAYIPTHRAEIRIFRNNEKRATFKCHFPEKYKVLKDVRFIKAESIHMDGSRWPFFEDSRRLEDLDLRLRDERGKNGYCYIEFIVRQISHWDSSDMMPHLTVLGRRVVGTGEVLEFSK